MGEHQVFDLTVQMNEEAKKLDIDSVAFFVATYQKELKLIETTIHVDEILCATDNPNRDISDNQFAKIPLQSCVLSNGSNLRIGFKFLNNDPVVFWSAAEKKTDSMISFLNSDKSYVKSAIHVTHSTKNTTIDSIIKVWDEIQIVKLLIYLFCGMLLLGIFFLYTSQNNWIILSSLSTVMFSIASLTCIITPPLQGPDEADHIRSFLHLIEEDLDLSESLDLMQKGHYENIMCKSGSGLTTHDLENQASFAWPSHAALYSVQKRSWTAYKAWPTVNNFFSKSISNKILEIRLLQGFIIVFFISVFLSLFMDKNFFQLTTLSFPFLIPPAFWHLSTHASNHIFLILGYISIGFLIWSILARRIYLSQVFVTGLIIILSLLGGRLGQVTFFIAIGLYGYRGLVYGCKNSLLGLGFLIAFYFTMNHFLMDVSYLKHRIAINTAISMWDQRNDFVLPVLIMIWGAIWLLVKKESEIFSSRLRKYINAFIILTTLLVIFLPFFYQKEMINIEWVTRPSSHEYLFMAFKSLVSTFGLGGSDFIITNLFWAGIGCPGWFPLPDPMIQLLKVTVIIGVALALTCGARKVYISNLINVSIILSILASYFMLIVYASWQRTVTLQGRYLLGFYIGLFFVAAFGFYQLSSLYKDKISPQLMGRCLMSLMMTAQCLTLYTIMTRYYI